MLNKSLIVSNRGVPLGLGSQVRQMGHVYGTRLFNWESESVPKASQKSLLLG